MTALTEPESATALCTLDRVKEIVAGLEGAAMQEHDSEILALIDEVSAWMVEYCGRQWRHADTDITEYFDVEDDETRDLYVAVRPINSVSHVYEDALRDYGDETELFESDDDFITYAADGFLRHCSAWCPGDRTVKVIYKGGYATVRSLPANVSGTAANICGYIWKQHFDGSNRLGITSESKGDGSVGGLSVNLPPWLREQLELLRSGGSLGA